DRARFARQLTSRRSLTFANPGSDALEFRHDLRELTDQRFGQSAHAGRVSSFENRCRRLHEAREPCPLQHWRRQRCVRIDEQVGNRDLENPLPRVKLTQREIGGFVLLPRNLFNFKLEVLRHPASGDSLLAPYSLKTMQFSVLAELQRLGVAV